MAAGSADTPSSARSWGNNASGQRGDGTTTNRTSPVQVKGLGGLGDLSGINALAGGNSHSLALNSGGMVLAWGSNASDQLGASTSGTCGTSPCSTSPVQAAGLAGTAAIAGGGSHSLAAATTQQATTTYGYDRLYRLTGVITASTPITYTYDPADNRVSLTKGLSVTNYTYDRADRIQQAGSVAYTMNANGNLINRGSDTFAYDQANRLKSDTVAGVASTYAYAYNGPVKAFC